MLENHHSPSHGHMGPASAGPSDNHGNSLSAADTGSFLPHSVLSREEGF